MLRDTATPRLDRLRRLARGPALRFCARAAVLVLALVVLAPAGWT